MHVSLVSRTAILRARRLGPLNENLPNVLSGDRDSVDVSKLIAVRSTQTPSLRKTQCCLVWCVQLDSDREFQNGPNWDVRRARRRPRQHRNWY